MSDKRAYTAKTPVELIAKIYKAHGWVRKYGESRTKRVGELYEISLDYNRGVYIATRKT